jgi:hypothetical protein
VGEAVNGDGLESLSDQQLQVQVADISRSIGGPGAARMSATMPRRVMIKFIRDHRIEDAG